MEKKMDLRVRRTRKSLRDALMQLLSYKNINDISVTELSALAHINRKTFYTYYSSINDVLSEIEDEVITALTITMRNYDFLDESFNSTDFYTDLNKFITEDMIFYQKLFTSTSHNLIFDKIKELLKNTLLTRHSGAFSNDPIMENLYAEFMISGLLSMFKLWFFQETPFPLEKVTDAARSVSMYGMNHFYDQKNIDTDLTT